VPALPEPVRVQIADMHVQKPVRSQPRKIKVEEHDQWMQGVFSGCIVEQLPYLLLANDQNELAGGTGSGQYVRMAAIGRAVQFGPG